MGKLSGEEKTRRTALLMAGDSDASRVSKGSPCGRSASRSRGAASGGWSFLTGGAD
jgi:hypothetical protein